MAIFDFIKRGFQRMNEQINGVKDVFALDGVPAWRQFYTDGIFIWKAIYKGFYKNWHVISVTTPAHEKVERYLARLNMGKASVQELASLIWGERCAVNVSMNNSEKTDLNDFINSVLRENNFSVMLGEHIERVLALGGGALKVWCEQGEGETPAPKIKIGYAVADQFVPTKWDNKEVSEGFFVTRKAEKGYYYTKIEWHKWNGEDYVIQNTLYRADNQDILGIQCPLEEMYPLLMPETVMKNIGHSLFAYYRVASANNLDDNSPLGISLYANAMDTLHALDMAFDGFNSYIKLGKPKILVPASALRTVVDPTTGQMRRYYDPNTEVYEGLSMDEQFEIKDVTIQLHVEEHVAAINALLNIYCLQTGFSPATFTFDRQGGIKTATEVISENSKTYKTVTSQQENIKPALERLVDSIIDIACLYEIRWNGVPISSMISGGYSVSIAFDDSIIQDRKTNLDTGIMLVTNGLISKKEFLTNVKYGIGMTEEQAEAMLQEVTAETRSVNAATMDLFNRDTFDGGEFDA